MVDPSNAQSFQLADAAQLRFQDPSKHNENGL
jgi:hypothetical protein